MAREEFIKKVKEIPLEKLVYLDESGIEDNACPTNGWSTEQGAMPKKSINIQGGYL